MWLFNMRIGYLSRISILKINFSHLPLSPSMKNGRHPLAICLVSTVISLIFLSLLSLWVGGHFAAARGSHSGGMPCLMPICWTHYSPMRRR